MPTIFFSKISIVQEHKFHWRCDAYYFREPSSLSPPLLIHLSQRLNKTLQTSIINFRTAYPTFYSTQVSINLLWTDYNFWNFYEGPASHWAACDNCDWRKRCHVWIKKSDGHVSYSLDLAPSNFHPSDALKTVLMESSSMTTVQWRALSANDCKRQTSSFIALAYKIFFNVGENVVTLEGPETSH